MPVPSLIGAARIRGLGAGRLAMRALSFGVLWAILSGGRGWAVGAPAILVATVVSAVVTPVNRWSFAGIARFLPYFLWNSLRGGIDVAARALHAGLPIDPGVLRYEMRLDNAAARVLMANTVTLLPGTLSAGLDGKVLIVHVLNAPGFSPSTLDELQRRIADLFRHDP